MVNHGCCTEVLPRDQNIEPCKSSSGIFQFLKLPKMITSVLFKAKLKLMYAYLNSLQVFNDIIYRPDFNKGLNVWEAVSGKPVAERR